MEYEDIFEVKKAQVLLWLHTLDLFHAFKLFMVALHHNGKKNSRKISPNL